MSPNDQEPIGHAEIPIYSFRGEDGEDLTIPDVELQVDFKTPAGKLQVGVAPDLNVFFIRLCNVKGGTTYIRADELAVAGGQAAIADNPNHQSGGTPSQEKTP